MKFIIKLIILKLLVLLNIVFINVSFADNHNIYETLKILKLNKINNFRIINLNINFINISTYDYKNGKKKTLKLFALGSLNLNY